MGRPLRGAIGGLAYRVLNRARGRTPLFEKPADNEAFEGVLQEAHADVDRRLLPDAEPLALCALARRAPNYTARPGNEASPPRQTENS